MFSEVLALHRQGVVSWQEGSARDEAAAVGDDRRAFRDGDGAEALVNLLFSLRSYLQGGTTAVASAWTPGDPAGGNRIDLSGGARLLLVHNPGDDPVSLRVWSSADLFNRLDDQDHEIPPVALVAFGPYVAHGWAQHDQYLYVEPALEGLRLAVIEAGGRQDG